MRFSIICACKDELEDISLALWSSLQQNYENFELIFVDDSTDGTKEYLKSISDKRLRVIDGDGEGCCRARNKGIRAATGDVLVFLTADTRLEQQYLSEISPFFANKLADMILLDARSFNDDNPFTQFLNIQHVVDSKGLKTTSQGYAVVRDVALEVGCITAEPAPFNFCQDWSLGHKIIQNGGRALYVPWITVPHKSPGNWQEFMKDRMLRGRMSGFDKYYRKRKSLPLVFTLISLKLIRTLCFGPIRSFSNFFAFKSAMRQLNYSDVSILVIGLILFFQTVMFTAGEFQSLLRIIRHNVRHKCAE